MGLLDSLLSDGSLIENLSQLGSENPQILQAAAALLSEDPNSPGGTQGLGSLLQGLQSGGLGDVVSSWLGAGANKPVSAGSLADSLGAGALDQFAQQAGIGADQAPSVLAGILPELVNQLSPQGQAPDSAGLGNLLGTLLKA